MMLHEGSIYGNSLARKTAIDALRNDSHHTILLEGPKGIGKAIFAGQLAAYLLNGGKVTLDQIELDSDHPTVKQINNRSHPDFYYLGSEEFSLKSKKIPVDSLEKIHHFCHRQGNSPYRIVIIDALDDCVPMVCHGLLKLLEEPPSGVVFLLIAHQLGRVLDTIQSRALKVNFQSLNDDEMLQCLPTLELGEQPPSDESLTAIAAGSPAIAEMLANADLDGLLEKLKQYLSQPSALGQANSIILHYICDKKHDHLAAWQYIARFLVRNLIRLTIDHRQPIKLQQAKTIFDAFHSAIHGGMTGSTLSIRLQETLALLDKVQQPPAYLDAEQTVQSVLLQWHGIIHPQP